MDSRDTIEPFTAYLSTNCQVCLYLIDYVVEHAQKHTQKPIEQQIWFNSMIRCRFCPNKMPFDRIPAHIERKHSGSESNTKYRKVNQPKHDCDLLRNSLALTSSPQTLHTANQSEPIACHISSRTIQSLNSSADSNEQQDSNEKRQSVNEAKHNKFIPIKPIIICPGTPSSEDDSENDEHSQVTAENEDLHLSNETKAAAEQMQSDCQQEIKPTDYPLALLRKPSQISFNFLTKLTENHKTDSSISNDVVDHSAKHSIHNPIFAQQKCEVSQNEDSLSDNPLERNGESTVADKEAIFIDNGNSAKKRTSTYSLEDSLDGQDMKKLRDSDFNQNQSDPLNEVVKLSETSQNDCVVLEEDKNTHSTHRNVQRPSSHDDITAQSVPGIGRVIPLIDNQILTNQSIDAVKDVCSTPINASNGVIERHSSSLQSGFGENDSRNNFHSVYISEYVLNKFMELGCIRTQNGRLFIQES